MTCRASLYVVVTRCSHLLCMLCSHGRYAKVPGCIDDDACSMAASPTKTQATYHMPALRALPLKRPVSQATPMTNQYALFFCGQRIACATALQEAPNPQMSLHHVVAYPHLLNGLSSKQCLWLRSRSMWRATWPRPEAVRPAHRWRVHRRASNKRGFPKEERRSVCPAACASF